MTKSMKMGRIAVFGLKLQSIENDGRHSNLYLPSIFYYSI